MIAPTPLRRDLPERADEDVVARVIHLTLGGDAKTLRVLTIEENRVWVAYALSLGRTKIAEITALQSLDEIAALLLQTIDIQLDALLAYDVDKVLDDRAWVDKHATDGEVYRAIKLVTVAAFPPGIDIRQLLPELIPVIAGGVSRGIAAATVAMASSQFTNAQRRLTAGSRKRSKKSSPTSSSSATSSV